MCQYFFTENYISNYIHIYTKTEIIKSFRLNEKGFVSEIEIYFA